MQAAIPTITVSQPDAVIARTQVPMLTVTCDERQACRLAHDYLGAHDYAEGLPTLDATDLPNYAACSSYYAGLCGGNGHQGLCLFAEPPTSAGWTRVRAYRQLPDGALCPTRIYARSLADYHAWSSAKPFADLVARSYDIETDAAGAVLADRYIVTTGADLLVALALCLALTGCNESEAHQIIQARVPQALTDPDAEISLPASTIYGLLSSAALHGVRLAEIAALFAEVAL